MDTWPVILNQSLQGSAWDKVLRQNRMKIRGSNCTIENSVIFPKSGVAFLVISLSSCTIGQFDIKHDVLQLTEKFTQLHARGYALMLASLHSEREMRICSEIQTKFLDTKLQMIAIHSVDEGIQAMINIAKDNNTLTRRHLVRDWSDGSTKLNRLEDTDIHPELDID
ncbi:unnamed protein product [Mytilus coruscus]|uniref:Uncharacterized protein n=1 Tax=Mytilus coruscus TaxID=42192 RepID=A0A6J8BMY4_MYTCO|nr:unnamed protein product [Mytilus coruscus]